MATLLTAVDDVPADGSYLFTVEEPDGSTGEVILVRLADGVSAWRNFCQHETDQPLDLGRGVARRDDEIICPKHGSAFDVESGHCENGPAAGSTLEEVDVTVRHGQVYLTDGDVTFRHQGASDDDGPPDSTSHLRF
jgi:nitrite reductase/ring-hydroxylating ferredoxin subunit